jgi:hypothetical protein
LGTANNGNVAGITNNINTARSQSFTYDSLNRISTAATQATTGTYAWGLSFGYDPWANLLSASVTQGSAPPLSMSALGNNRLSGYSYDASGNMLSDGTNRGPGTDGTFSAPRKVVALLTCPLAPRTRSYDTKAS